jgi:hypothetical protein
MHMTYESMIAFAESWIAAWNRRDVQAGAGALFPKDARRRPLRGITLAHSTNRIVWISGINKAGTADGEEFLHFTNCFGDHVVRLTGLKLGL